MKTFKFLVAGMFLFLAVAAQAQISVNINLGTPPQWGPAGYTDVQYYYLPDVEAYYDVPSARFIYFDGVTWIRRAHLPSRYRSYDLYNGYKVVMTDYRGNEPYAHFKDHKIKYAKGYHGQAQKNIGEKPGKGNSGKNVYSKSHLVNKPQGNVRSSGHGNDKKNNSHGGGKGKK